MLTSFGIGPLAAQTVRLLHVARIAQRIKRARMLLMQKDRKRRPDGFAARRDCALEQMVLHLLWQVAPNPDDSLAKGARELVRGRAGIRLGRWHLHFLPQSYPISGIDRLMDDRAGHRMRDAAAGASAPLHARDMADQHGRSTWPIDKTRFQRICSRELLAARVAARKVIPFRAGPVSRS